MAMYKVKEYESFIEFYPGSHEVKKTHEAGAIIQVKDIAACAQAFKLIPYDKDAAFEENELQGKDGAVSDAPGAGGSSEGNVNNTSGADAGNGDANATQDDGSPASRRLAAIAKLSKANGASN